MILYRAAYPRDGAERYVTFAAENQIEAAIWLAMWEQAMKVAAIWLIEVGPSRFKHRSRA